MVSFFGFGQKAVDTVKSTTYKVGGGWKTGSKSAKRKTADIMQGQHGIKVDSVSSTLRGYLRTDPDLAANARRFVDNALMEAPELIPKSGEKVAAQTLKSMNEQLSEVRFYKLLRGIVYSLIFAGNAFMEVKFSGKKLKEAYMIDPDQMEIVVNDFGEIIQYVQTPLSGGKIYFDVDEIVHISIDHFSTSVVGEVFLAPLESAMLRKEIAESYLEWILSENKLAPLIEVKADMLDDEQWTRILSEINYKKLDPNKLQAINTGMDDEIKLHQIFTTTDFDVIMKYIDKQKEEIITLLQVPPIISGTVDNSNRSNSEIQARLVFYNTIRAFQNLLAEELNYELLNKKLKWNKVYFKFAAIDQRVDVETIKLAKSLRVDLNFTEDAIVAFLEQNGFKIPKVDKLFEEVPVAMQGKMEENSPDSPSREPRDKGGLVKNEAQRKEDKSLGVSEVKN